MISNIKFADQAKSAIYDGIPYTKLDCQAFVEKVLYDAGARKENGKAYDWSGVNGMYRNAFTWKGTIAECKKVYGCIPVGAWAIIWKNDGGEKERGYYDGLGNAKHVGIYVGNDQVRDSTRTTKNPVRNGVGYRSINDFNIIGLPFMIDYFGSDLSVNKPENPNKQKVLEALEVIKLYIIGGK